jgi:hypothetical protein
MIDDQLVLRVERLRDSIENLRAELHGKYKQPIRQVTSKDIRETAARLAETWMVDVAARADVQSALSPPLLADLNIHFQRLLTYPDQATLRKKYDAVIKGILRDFRTGVVVPLKQKRGPATDALATIANVPPATPLPSANSIFVGHSFADDDAEVVKIVVRFLTALGLEVLTGEKPTAGSVSSKVRQRIDKCDAFAGVFTRRGKISGKKEWTASPWIVDEKAYALAKSKKLLLMKEAGVQSIGGLQGDYEYLEFTREHLADLLIRLAELIADGRAG